jgi:membrane-bound serine protease (ClpP class)
LYWIFVSEDGFLKHFLFIFLLVLPLYGEAQSIPVLSLHTMIDPASADFLHHGMETAAARHAPCVIIQLNTPGGLLTSTRSIVHDILESPIPVIVYVAPGGSQAGSAGVFITMAAHIAVMAPGTNIGAAHPVSSGGTMDSVMSRKVTNDAAAFIRTLAEKRDRNIVWAETAVRESKAISETEALNAHVVDYIAQDVPDLLCRIDGKRIAMPHDTVELHVAHMHYTILEMSPQEKFLDLLSNPDIAYVLMMLGFFGLLFEMHNPGAIVPGIVGFISLVLAVYSMYSLPVNSTGVVLILFGIALFVLEIKITSHGILTVGGIISFFLGSLMLIRTDDVFETVSLSTSVMIVTTLVTAAFFMFLIGLGLKVQRRTARTGKEGLIGETGIAITVLAPSGTVHVHGETWQAISTSGTISEGAAVRVQRLEQLTLMVEPITFKKE